MTAELKLKRDVKERWKQDFSYGLICILSAFKLGHTTRITSRNPPVTLCICVRQPQQRGPLLLLTGVKPNLDGDKSRAISSQIAFYISYLLRTEMYF